MRGRHQLQTPARRRPWGSVSSSVDGDGDAASPRAVVRTSGRTRTTTLAHHQARHEQSLRLQLLLLLLLLI